MNPSIAANQQRLFLAFLAELRPHLREDSGLPRRIKEIFSRNRSLGSRDRKLYRELIYTAVRFLPWVDGARQRGDGQAAGLAPTAGSEAEGARSAGAPRARDEQTALLDTNPTLAAKIIAWLLPTLPPTEAYQKAICEPWVLAPEKADLPMKAFMLRAYCGGSRPVPSLAERAAELRQQLSPGGAQPPDALHPFDPQSLLPDWFHEHCPAAFTEPHLTALHERAWIWVRVQCSDRQLVLSEFLDRKWALGLPADFPDAICLPPNAEVANTDAYRRGFVEIQDLGSQMVLAHAPVAPGQRWLDACAGAGGKTLQLARLVPDGHVDATDIRPEILEELRERAKRARLDNVRITNKPADAYDGVLVDAPCSGSGTWRRQPHLKWCMDPSAITAFAGLQLAILTTNAPRVKPGGLLVYATCSLSHHENHDVVAAFLKAHLQFKAERPAKNHGGDYDDLGTTLLPGTRNTDGFYVALLRRIS